MGRESRHRDKPTNPKSCPAATTLGCSRSFGPTAPIPKRPLATGLPSSMGSWTTPTSKPDGWAKATRWRPSTGRCVPTSPWAGPCTMRPSPHGATRVGTTTSAPCRRFVGCKDAGSAPTRQLPNYDVTGLPLIDGFCEMVTPGDLDFPKRQRRRQTESPRLERPRLH